MADLEIKWDALREKLTQYKQEHLIRFLPELSEPQKAELYEDIAEIDFSSVERHFADVRPSLWNGSEEKKDEILQPLDSSICGSTARDTESAKHWEKLGKLSCY